MDVPGSEPVARREIIMGSPFRIVGGDQPVQTAPAAVEELTPVLRERLDQLVQSEDVFVFMKGVPHRPACGFSANVVAILNKYGISFGSFDVLSDPELRAGLKLYSKWPTFPQVFVLGELIGGHDIVAEMAECGELEEALQGVQA